MAQHRDMGIGQRPADPSRLVFFREIEAAVHRGDHEVEGGQHLVGIVHRAVSQDVSLDAFEDPHVRKLLLHRGDLGVLRPDAVFFQAVRVEGRLAVVGDADVAIPKRSRRPHHLLQRRRAVAVDGVRVEDPLDLPRLEQHRQAPALSQFDLPMALAQLRRDEREACSCIDGFFRLPSKRDATADQSLRECLHMLSVAGGLEQLPPVVGSVNQHNDHRQALGGARGDAVHLRLDVDLCDIRHTGQGLH